MVHPVPFTVKITHIYDYLSSSQRRPISLEDMVEGLRKLQLEFTEATAQELHGKADANNDGYVTKDELYRFGELYPTLADCMYYRVVDSDESKARVACIEGKADNLTHLRQQLCGAKESLMLAQQAAQEAELSLATQMQNVQSCMAREEQLRNAQDLARQETEQARCEVRRRISDANNAKDSERQAATAAMDAKRQVEATARRLAFQEAKLSQAEEAVREIERQLQAARRNVESEQGECARARGENREALTHEQHSVELLNEAGRVLSQVQDEVSRAEGVVQDKHTREKEVAQNLIDCAQELSNQKGLKDVCAQAAQSAKDHERQSHAAEEAALRVVEHAEADLDDFNRQHKDDVMRREMTNTEELPLLEEEITLRKQRETLEQREMQLNNNVTHLNGKSDRPSSPPRSAGARSPAMASPRPRVLSATPQRSGRM